MGMHTPLRKVRIQRRNPHVANDRDLEKRLSELEAEVSALKAARTYAHKGIRARSSWGIGDLPFYEIAFGPDFSRGEVRGHARGFIAIGDLATGVFALGGLARGVFAVGGMAAGLISAGGMSLGLLLGAGGMAMGGAAFGGMAVGGVAIGGLAAGHYACGAGTAATHGISESLRDPAAVAFFEEYGLLDLCRTRRR